MEEKIVLVDEYEMVLWQQVYEATIRLGSGSVSAAMNADRAILDFRERLAK